MLSKSMLVAIGVIWLTGCTKSEEVSIIDNLSGPANTQPSASSTPAINRLGNLEIAKQDFVEKTKRKNYNLGEMWDASKDLSEKREKERGVDPVK